MRNENEHFSGTCKLWALFSRSQGHRLSIPIIFLSQGGGLSKTSIFRENYVIVSFQPFMFTSKQMKRIGRAIKS